MKDNIVLVVMFFVLKCCFLMKVYFMKDILKVLLVIKIILLCIRKVRILVRCGYQSMQRVMILIIIIMKKEQRVKVMGKSIIFILKRAIVRLVIQEIIRSGLKVNIYRKVQKGKFMVDMQGNIILGRMDFIILLKVRSIRNIRESMQRVEQMGMVLIQSRVVFLLKVIISMLKKVVCGSIMRKGQFIMMRKFGIRVKQRDIGKRSIRKVIMELSVNGVLSIFKNMMLVYKGILLRGLRFCLKRVVV